MTSFVERFGVSPVICFDPVLSVDAVGVVALGDQGTPQSPTERSCRELRKPQSYVSKCESGERCVDVIELEEFARHYRKAIGFFVR